MYEKFRLGNSFCFGADISGATCYVTIQKYNEKKNSKYLFRKKTKKKNPKIYSQPKWIWRRNSPIANRKKFFHSHSVFLVMLALHLIYCDILCPQPKQWAHSEQEKCTRDYDLFYSIRHSVIFDSRIAHFMMPYQKYSAMWETFTVRPTLKIDKLDQNSVISDRKMSTQHRRLVQVNFFFFNLRRTNTKLAKKSIRNLDVALDTMIFISVHEFSAVAKFILTSAQSSNINQQKF